MNLEHIINSHPVGYEADLAAALKAAPEGIFCEFGVSVGRRTREIASRIPDKTYYGFDSFEGLPEDWTTASGHVRDRKGAFKADPPTDIPNLQCVIGLFQDTVKPFFETYGPLAFAHFDADLYSSTKYVLMALRGHYAPNAILMFDQITRDDFCVEHEGRAMQEFIMETGCEWQLIGRQKRDGAIFRISGV